VTTIGPAEGSLEEIRSRAQERTSHPNRTAPLTQSEIDRATLLRMLDEARADTERWHAAFQGAARDASRQADAAQDATRGVADAWAFLAGLRATMAANGHRRATLLDENADTANWAARWLAADEAVLQAVAAESGTTFQWGESVTWADGRTLVHLNLLDTDAADLELDRDDAELLGTMLLDTGRSARCQTAGKR
jgi:hypothetical protein